MKKYTYSILAAILASGMAQGAATAYTAPVGYITMNVTGGGSNANPVSSFIGPALANSATWQGLSLGTGTGSTVDFSGTPFTVSQFGLNSTLESKYYAQVLTGPNAGMWSDIASNTTNSITCDDAIAAQFANQTIVIRQHHTIASLFGITSATIPFKAGPSIGSADEVVLVNSTTQAPVSYYFSTDDGDEDGFEDGWLRADLTPSSDKVVTPMDGVSIQRKAAGSLAITQSGDVNLVSPQVMIVQGTNIVPINRAVSSSMRLSPLTASAVANGRTGSNLVGSGMTKGPSIGTADELTILVSGIPVSYYYSTDDGDEDGFEDGWLRADLTPSGDLVIPDGSAVQIQRKSATPFMWKVPNEAIDQDPIIGISN